MTDLNRTESIEGIENTSDADRRRGKKEYSPASLQLDVL